MREGTQQGLIVMIGLVLVVVVVAIGWSKSAADNNRSVVDCVKATGKPLECRQAISGK